MHPSWLVKLACHICKIGRGGRHFFLMAVAPGYACAGYPSSVYRYGNSVGEIVHTGPGWSVYRQWHALYVVKEKSHDGMGGCCEAEVLDGTKVYLPW